MPERVVKKMVEERRRKQQRADEMTDVAKEIRRIVKSAEEYGGMDIRKVTAYM
jgi:hypothetical protein